MIEYLLLLLLVKYRNVFDGHEPIDTESGINGPYAGLFIDDEPPVRRTPELRLIKCRP